MSYEPKAESEPEIPQNQPPQPADNKEMSVRIAQLRGTYNKRRFDKNRFLMLEKNKAPLPDNGEDDN
jgi:hypothetical protein